MHLRFRKSFPIVGHLLHLTVSRHGVSLNLHAGLFSRSWGTRYATTTIDAPGHFGLYWRKQAAHTQHRPHEIAEARHEHHWLHLTLALAFLAGAVEAIHIWVHPFSQTQVVGHPLTTLLLLMGALIGVIFLTDRLGLVSGIFIFLLGLGAIYLEWTLFHSLAWHDVHSIAVTHASQTVHRATIHHVSLPLQTTHRLARNH